MLGSSELVVILVLALIFFGPQKLPELARALGQAAGEYHKATREFEQQTKKVTDEIQKEARDLNKDVMVTESRQNSAEIKKISRSLGISTEGKDDAQLLKDIDVRVGKKRIASKPKVKSGVTPKAKSGVKPKAKVGQKPEADAKAHSSPH